MQNIPFINIIMPIILVKVDEIFHLVHGCNPWNIPEYQKLERIRGNLQFSWSFTPTSSTCKLKMDEISKKRMRRHNGDLGCISCIPAYYLVFWLPMQTSDSNSNANNSSLETTTATERWKAAASSETNFATSEVTQCTTYGSVALFEQMYLF